MKKVPWKIKEVKFLSMKLFAFKIPQLVSQMKMIFIVGARKPKAVIFLMRDLT